MNVLMRSTLKRMVTAVCVLCFVPVFSKEPIPKALDILQKMLAAVQNVHTVRYTLNISERLGVKNHNAISEIKLQVNPRKLFLKNPKKGTEVLWVQGENEGDCWVYPNGFPYATLSLSPFGDIMRKNQHHTIHDLGFGFIAKTIRGSIFKLGLSPEKIFHYTGDVVWDNDECYQLFAGYADFKYISYKVEKGENISSIANEFNCGEYRILEKNTELQNYNDAVEGKTLLIPNNYSSKTILYVNKKSMLPVNIIVYDDKGFYESFEYHNIVVNKPFLNNEFSKDFKDYHF